MANLIYETQGSIFNKGKMLSVHAECFSTVVWIYLIDKTRYFPVVDKFKIKRPNKLSHHDIMMLALQHARIHDLF